jgi:hypothetical protein
MSALEHHVGALSGARPFSLSGTRTFNNPVVDCKFFTPLDVSRGVIYAVRIVQHDYTKVGRLPLQLARVEVQVKARCELPNARVLQNGLRAKIPSP